MGVTLDHVTFRYGDAVAVEDVSLRIQPGELFGLLGPSGCGKTTTLRMIAGFLRPDSGRIMFGDRDVTSDPPEDRHIGMVFQNYALFPHMTVADNVAFGLAARNVPRADRTGRVREALRLVQLEGLADRSVADLSGGQQQRVAVARAVVTEPAVLLLDEPLSNLDARLRTETGQELKALQRRLGITTIYVTHDQTEALSMCDRLAVMRNGACEQVGTPEEVFARPASGAVADFLGRSNVIPVDGVTDSEEGWIATAGSVHLSVATAASNGTVRALAIRAHLVKLGVPDDSVNVLTAAVTARRFLGADVELSLEAEGMHLTALVRPGDSGAGAAPGDSVAISLPPDSLWPLTDM